MSVEDLRALERAAASGNPEDVERYVCARIRRSPDLIEKLVKRVIRLERVVTAARANEEQYYASVSMDDFIKFLDRDVPERSLAPGELVIEGEWPKEGDEDAARGGRVVLSGGRCRSGDLSVQTMIPSNMELHHMILALTLRIEMLERDRA